MFCACGSGRDYLLVKSTTAAGTNCSTHSDGVG